MVEAEALAPSRDEIVEVWSVCESSVFLKSERIWLDWRAASARHLANSSLSVDVDAVPLVFDALSLARADVLVGAVLAAAELANPTDEIWPVDAVTEGLMAVVPDDACAAAADGVAEGDGLAAAGADVSDGGDNWAA